MLVLLGKWGDTLLPPVVHILWCDVGRDSWHSAAGAQSCSSCRNWAGAKVQARWVRSGHPWKVSRTRTINKQTKLAIGGREGEKEGWRGIYMCVCVYVCVCIKCQLSALFLILWLLRYPEYLCRINCLQIVSRPPLMGRSLVLVCAIFFQFYINIYIFRLFFIIGC